jgi:hypothetical protein
MGFTFKIESERSSSSDIDDGLVEGESEDSCVWAEVGDEADAEDC